MLRIILSLGLFLLYQTILSAQCTTPIQSISENFDSYPGTGVIPNCWTRHISNANATLYILTNAIRTTH